MRTNVVRTERKSSASDHSETRLRAAAPARRRKHTRAEVEAVDVILSELAAPEWEAEERARGGREENSRSDRLARIRREFRSIERVTAGLVVDAHYAAPAELAEIVRDVAEQVRRLAARHVELTVAIEEES